MKQSFNFDSCVFFVLSLFFFVMLIVLYFKIDAVEHVEPCTNEIVKNITVEMRDKISDIETESLKTTETEAVNITEKEKIMIAQVVMAEAEGESLLGKVAVAITVFNRCDLYDQSISEVVHTPNAYAHKAKFTEECYDAVELAINSRNLFPSNMIYFCSGGWSQYGKHWITIENHNFSTDGDPIYEY